MHGMAIFLNLCSLVVVLISFGYHQEMEKTYKRKTTKIEVAFLLFEMVCRLIISGGRLSFLFGMQKKIFHVSFWCNGGVHPTCTLSTAVTSCRWFSLCRSLYTKFKSDT